MCANLKLCDETTQCRDCIRRVCSLKNNCVCKNEHRVVSCVRPEICKMHTASSAGYAFVKGWLQFIIKDVCFHWMMATVD